MNDYLVGDLEDDFGLDPDELERELEEEARYYENLQRGSAIEDEWDIYSDF